MNPAIILLSVLSVCLAAPSNHTVFYHPTIGGRIVGGTAAHIEDLPWQVAVLRNGQQICGGILIAPKVVLTAAHCLTLRVIPLLSQLNVRSGSTQHNSGGTRVAAASRILHPLYQDCDTCAPDYDIAVIHLAARADVGVAKTIALWDAGSTFPAGTYATVSGWGLTSELGSTGVVNLRRVNVPVVANAQCRAVYGSIISIRTICAGYPNGGRDSCQGDSGGPFVINGKLAGVVSFGAGCARAGLPGVYASVPGYRAWIRENARV